MCSCSAIKDDNTEQRRNKTVPKLKRQQTLPKKVFLSLSVRNTVLFMFWFPGDFLLLVLNTNLDGEDGYNVFNSLVEVYDNLLETGSWLKEDKSFFRKTN